MDLKSAVKGDIHEVYSLLDFQKGLDPQRQPNARDLFADLREGE